MIADQDGNKGVVCVDVSAAKKECTKLQSGSHSRSWRWWQNPARW